MALNYVEPRPSIAELAAALETSHGDQWLLIVARPPCTRLGLPLATDYGQAVKVTPRTNRAIVPSRQPALIKGTPNDGHHLNPSRKTPDRSRTHGHGGIHPDPRSG